MPEPVYLKIRLLSAEKLLLDEYKKEHGVSFAFLTENALSVLLNRADRQRIVNDYLGTLKQQKIDKKIRELQTHIKEPKVNHTERFSITLKPETHAAAQAFCVENGYKLSDVLRAALQSYIQ